ncbi:MAG TPA: hypothetical protein VFR76_10855 [Verrucomicrobiae bacterium]|nr:hypothetical protein [Verrucomicrobiae bacterium]
MNTKGLIQLGVPPGETSRRGMEYIARVLGRFDPKLVKMAPHGERPED